MTQPAELTPEQQRYSQSMEIIRNSQPGSDVYELVEEMVRQIKDKNLMGIEDEKVRTGLIHYFSKRSEDEKDLSQWVTERLKVQAYEFCCQRRVLASRKEGKLSGDDKTDWFKALEVIANNILHHLKYEESGAPHTACRGGDGTIY